jgi:hypothetical protein
LKLILKSVETIYANLLLPKAIMQIEVMVVIVTSYIFMRGWECHCHVKMHILSLVLGLKNKQMSHTRHKIFYSHQISYIKLDDCLNQWLVTNINCQQMFDEDFLAHNVGMNKYVLLGILVKV